MVEHAPAKQFSSCLKPSSMVVALDIIETPKKKKCDKEASRLQKQKKLVEEDAEMKEVRPRFSECIRESHAPG